MLCAFSLGREVWPDDVFGCHGISVDDELEVIRSILMNPSAGK